MPGLIIGFCLMLIGAAGFAGNKVSEKGEPKTGTSRCIMEQIELSEENRGNYFPRMRNEILHGFIIQCIRDGKVKKAKK